MSSAAPGACAFCDIVAGRAAATLVASDPLTVAFLDQRQFHPGHVLRGALAVLVLLCAVPAAAQPPQRFEAAVHVAASALPEFEGSDVGFGGRLAWRPDDRLTFEGELTLFPGEHPDFPRPFSRRRLEGLFGVTAGPRLGAVRPFAKVRAGFLDLKELSEPVVCILVFPPPLSCTLAAGRTLPAFDVGGGVDVNVTGRAFIRVEAGDRLVKYPGPAVVVNGVQAEAFYGHALRFAAGAGVRF